MRLSHKGAVCPGVSSTSGSHCRQDIAYRVITANRVPDHATVARFVCRHEVALAGLFGEVLALCDGAGLVECGVVALDGTKLRGNATRETSVDFGQIAQELIEFAIATDQSEDEEHGDARGDELPEELQSDEGRRAWLARELAARREAKREVEDEDDASGGHDFDAEQIVARVQGRDGWLLEGKRQLDRERWQAPAPVARAREDRLWNAAERLEQDLAALGRGNEAYEQWRATATDRLGRSLSGNRLPKPYTPPATPQTTVNLSDPDTHLMKGHKIFVQGYNAQAVVDPNQIVIAAEVSTEPVDFSALEPLISAARRELEHANISTRPRVASRGHRVLERAADGQARRRRDRRPRAARVRQAQRPTTGLVGRALQLDARTARKRSRSRALPTTKTGDRARVWSHQAQPQIHPVSPTRPRRRAHRMAITDDDAQPDQALPPPNSHSRGLKGPLLAPPSRPGPKPPRPALGQSTTQIPSPLRDSLA